VRARPGACRGEAARGRQSPLLRRFRTCRGGSRVHPARGGARRATAMRSMRQGSIWAALGSALMLGATPSVMAQGSDRASMLSNAPLARPMPGEAGNSFTREPAFPLGPLPGDLQAPPPAPQPRPVREIAIVPGATPAVAAPATAALPVPHDVHVKADRARALAERRREDSRRSAAVPVPAAAAEPGAPVVVGEVIAPVSPPARAVVVRSAPPTVIVAEPPPTMVQPLSPTGSGSWYFYDQPTERGSPGRR
jgi:hypothetical protein